MEDFQQTWKDYSEKNLDPQTLTAAKEKASQMSQQEMESYTEKSTQLVTQLITALNNHLPPDSPEVQALMQEHYELSQTFTPMTQEAYLASREALSDTSPLATMYAKLHPDLPAFCYKAMGVFAERKFGE